MNAVSALESDKPLAILNERLRERLDLVNGVKRTLGRQYRIIGQDLRLGSTRRPLLILAAGDEALRARLGGVLTTGEGARRCIVGRLHGVDVSWTQAGATP